MRMHQIDCFAINMKFFKVLGIWMREPPFRFYNVFSFLLIFTFIIMYDLLTLINLYFLPTQMDLIIEELIFFFMELSAVSKVLTFLFYRDNIANILDLLEAPLLQANNEIETKLIEKAKNFIKKYWIIITSVSLTSNATHILSPFIAHIFSSTTLDLPVCSYSFLSGNTTQKFIYPLFFYQSFGMHLHLWFKVNIDSFFLGLVMLIIAQLEILDTKLRTVTEVKRSEHVEAGTSSDFKANAVKELNKCIIRFDEVGKFCSLVEDTFTATLFMQFSMASCIICVVLFRFTLPAPMEYYVFLGTYMFVMTCLIFVPCWIGTRLMDKSVILCLSVYDCDWTRMPQKFKRNLLLFVERANRPLTITGGKMFTLSLATFSSIMNSSYSFFTLLRNVQTDNK